MKENSKKISAYLIGLRLLRTGISMITISLAAKFFGVSLERDVWILVSAFITTINLAVWGPVNETFRTKFIFIREEEGEQMALKKTGTLLLLMIAVIMGISAIMYIFPNFFMSFIAPSLSTEQSRVFVKMLYLLIPTFIINQITSIGISILNAYNYFYIPEIVGFFSGIINLICILILVPFIGIYSLVVSQYLSILLLLGVIIYFIQTKQIHVWFKSFAIHWQDVKPFIYFALPFFFPYFIGQCSGLLEKSLANLLGDGVVSTIDYSKKIVEILQSVLSSVLASVMVPVLALHFSKKNHESFSYDFEQYLQVVFVLLSVSLPILVGASGALNNFLFFRGEMHVSTINTIVSVTRFYGMAFISVALYLLLGLALLSQGKAKQYALFGICAQIIMVLMNVFLYKIFDVYTFAISMFVAHAGVVIFMFKFLHIYDKRNVLFGILKYLLVLIILICTLCGINSILVNVQPFFMLFISVVCVIVLLPLLYELFGFHVFRYLKYLLKRF